MRTVLILCGRYLPGYKDGGPVRSIKNLTDRLGDEFDFRIMTTDRDHGDEVPYPDIVRNAWNQVGKAKVWYVEPGGFTQELIENKASEVDVVYVCGCFNDYARTTLKLKKKGKIKKKVVVASMGLFALGAFHIKYWKKKAYITILKAGGYLKHIEWSATNEREIADIKREIGAKAVCRLAEDIPRQMTALPEPMVKQDALKLIFLSRISREKNLEFAIDVLKNVSGKVNFDFYGPAPDTAYFEQCMNLAKTLPRNINIAYKGEVPAEKVPEIFSQYQAFLFPTLGENYGHVVYEAMAGGCIPIISDRTPWNNIADAGAGKVIPLERKDIFTQEIQKLTESSAEECMEQQAKSAAYAFEYGRNVDGKGYRGIFGEQESDNG